MPARILLIEVGLRDNEQISGSRDIVSDNVRWSSYFIQLFQDDWGPRDLFRKLFLLALECREDPSMPMRDVVVCLKAAPMERNPEILAFRKELEEEKRAQVITYETPGQVKEHLLGVFENWTRSLIAEGAGAKAQS